MNWFMNNVRGMCDKLKRAKIIRASREADVIVLVETHLNEEEKEHKYIMERFKEELEKETKKEWFITWESSYGIKSNSRVGGVCICVSERVVENESELKVVKGGDGRSLVVTIPGITEEPINVIGVYMPINTKERKKWMNKTLKKLKEIEGRRVVMGDFNGIRDAELDKVGGLKDSGRETVKEEEKWIEEIGVDVYRERNPGEVLWTRKDHRTKTNIDKIFTDEHTNTLITKITKKAIEYSDHDALEITLDTNKEKDPPAPYDSIREEELKDERVIKKVNEIFEEEKQKEGKKCQQHDRMKERWREEIMKIRQKTRKNKNKKEKKRNKQIQKLSYLMGWAENARFQLNKGNKIKRWEYGNKLLEQCKWQRWMIPNGEININYLIVKINEELKGKMNEKDKHDERKLQIENEMKQMQDAQENGRGTKYFFDKVRERRKKEKIQSLLEMERKTENKINEEKERKNKEKEEEEDDQESEEKEYEESQSEDEQERHQEKKKPERKEHFEQKEIIKVAKQFYEELWSDCKSDEDKRRNLMNNITKKISEKQKQNLDKEVIKEEVEAILKKLQPNKAPGWDGIPAKFYTRFEWMADWLTEVFNEIIVQQQLAISMQTAVVTLLFKKGDRNEIGNYRPISLLCCDYKIFTKVLAERMKNVLNDIIQTSQQGFVKGGDIRGSIIQVKRIIEHCEREGEDAAIIFMDFQKAFDKVDHKCIEEVLIEFNFGPIFTQAVMSLYSNVKAKIVVNGELSADVFVKGGVRQGCPLSPYIFICILELLARRIQTDQEVQGVTEPHSKQSTKISLFADDAAAFITNVAGTITKLRKALGDYEEATGARLHDGKTMILGIGSNKGAELNFKQQGIEFEVMKETQVEKYLGSQVGNSVSETDRFKDPLEKSKKTSARWSRENISMHGRVLVANTVLLSKIRYRASCNTISKEQVEQIRKDQEFFIWKNKKTRRKWCHLVQQYDKGGMKLLDPECAFNAEKISILQRANKNEQHPWVMWKNKKDYEIRKKWGIVGDITRIQTNSKLKWNEEDLFEKTYQIWHSISTSKEAGTNKEGQDKKLQGIWWNPNITDSKGNSFYIKAIADSGFITVCDFNTLYATLKDTNGINNFNKTYKTNVGEIHKAVLVFLGKEINKDEQTAGVTTAEGAWCSIDTLASRDSYQLLINNKFPSKHTTNTAITEVRSKLSAKELDFWWDSLHNLTWTTPQLSHFNLATSTLKITSNKCPFCKTKKETRQHLNEDCEQAKNLWEKAELLYPKMGKFTAAKWNCTANKIGKTEIILTAKLRYQWHVHRYNILRKRSPATNIDLVISNWQIAIEHYERKYNRTLLQEELNNLA
jgi:endonuclease/exonuclease/phosphatase family metal-dependent hydrolase